MLEGQVFGEGSRGTGCWGRGVRRTGSLEGGGGVEVAKEGERD